MLGRVHGLYPQALVIGLVVATLLHLRRQRRDHRTQRIGTMLWCFLFAMTLELAYSSCLLGGVECDVVTWYVACTVLGVLGLAVLRRDDLIDATLAELVSDEKGMARATALHRTRSVVAVILAGALCLVAAALPGLFLGLGLAKSVTPALVVASLALPAVLMLLSRGGGLASALCVVVIALVGAARASLLAQGAGFSFPSDLATMASSFVLGQTAASLTRATVLAAVPAGAAVALCSLLFRLPRVVAATEGDVEHMAEDAEVLQAALDVTSPEPSGGMPDVDGESVPMA